MRRPWLNMMAVLGFLLAGPLAARAQAYKVTNLVSDGSVSAVTMDSNFLNPWGMSVSSTWWISTADTGYNYVVPSSGASADTIAFKVIIPAASGTGTGTPAGSVTTAGASGMVLPNGTKASFLFATLDGTIAGWNGKLGMANVICQTVVNNHATGAVYSGLALLNASSTASYVLAPNFGTGNGVEVYDNTFKPTHLAGSFTDPSLPANYAPYSIHILNNQVWVAYALRTTSAPYLEVAGPGNGIVDVFDSSGNFVTRAVTGGNLNAPWGVAFAPANFGIFSGDLLIGNFGDGHINVYDPKTYAYLGQLMDSTGASLTYASLWELLTGGTAVGNSTSVSGGDISTVYFTAGLMNQQHGLLAAISNATVSGASPTYGFTASAGAVTVTAGNSATLTLGVAPVNGFSGTVSFACSGLPAGAACLFNPSSVSAMSTAPATTMLTLNTTQRTTTGALQPAHGGGLMLAALLPLTSLLLLRRKRKLASALAVLLFAATGAFVIGCSDNGKFIPPGTPTGQSTVTITATSGSLSQHTTVALTVQ